MGVGHDEPLAANRGAALEYVFNVDHELREAGVRERARLVYLTNETQLGDFGVDGMTFDDHGFETTSELWTSSLYRERGVEALLGAHVRRVEPGVVHYETLDGVMRGLAFDFGMLLPPSGGVPLQAFDPQGKDITDQLFAPSGFMRVDADYAPKPYGAVARRGLAQDLRSRRSPERLRRGHRLRTAAPDLAAAHEPVGTLIAPSPPRTGMPSGVMGKTAALMIVDRIKHGDDRPAHEASMANMGAACIASAGAGMRRGSAAAMTMRPVVPDYTVYPTGRDLADTRGEIGLSGHWAKLMMHYLFIHKAKGRPGWQLIPE